MPFIRGRDPLYYCPTMSSQKYYSLKLFLIVVLLSIFSIPSAFSVYTLDQEANADQNLGGGRGFIGYGSNIANQLTNYSYDLCNIGNGDFSPLIYDFDNNGVVDVLVVDGNRLELYSINCDFITDFALGDTARAMPVLANFDGDEYKEIYILFDETAKSYQYDTTLDSFVLTATVDYNADVGATNLDYISCPQSSYKTCVAYNKGSAVVYVLDFETETAEERTGELPRAMLSSGSVTQGITSSNYLPAGMYYTPQCLSQGSTTNYLSCNIIDPTGYNQSINSGDLGSASFSITNVYYHSTFIAKMGNAYRIFMNVDYEKNSAFDRYQTIVFDSGFTQLHKVQGGGDHANQTSNWIVADYDKDGLNDACYLVNVTPDTYFRCYDAGFNLVKDINVTGTMDISKSLVFADFNNSKDTLGLATMEGIFYENDAGTDFEEFYDTGETSSGYRSGSVVSIPSTGSPIYVYVDSTDGFIVRDTEAVALCGNGVCDTFENDFTCPADCQVNVTGLLNATGEACIVDNDCESGYCSGGFCQLKGEYAECTSNDQCLSGTCSNNVCTNPGTWEQIEASKTEIFGNTTATNNFISIFITLAVVITIVIYGKNLMSVALAGVFGFVLLAFFTYVQMLSGWIFFMVFISMIAIILIIFKLGSSTD